MVLSEHQEHTVLPPSPVLRPKVPYRIYNTWMGDPAKVLQLEQVLDVIREDKLIENAAEVSPPLGVYCT